ncbi:MAG TPA: xanthine dehydrogenase family protein molybdopterin-binding subunit [Terriglobales bacterium]|nr:xanthine dehydrogenase family protein molybdopterin-binding subunit [Terriglobales bacterium]
MKLIENVSRRGFLQGALAGGVFVLSARFVPEPLWAAEDEAAAPLEPSLWMSIASDGTVTVVAHRSEMGCGSRTALPLVVADELDADWSKVRIEQAIGDSKYGDQDTDGSHSVRSNFDLMRQVGATGRVMLITAAAAQWGVSPKDCTTEIHFVVHRASGRKLGYGEVAAAAAKLPVPKKEDVPLKERSQWRYIGKESNALFDLSDIVTGKAIFGMDATMPGMVYASVEHPPVLGQKIKSYDDKAALQVPGVQKTLTIETFKPPHQFQPLGGVAVIADNTYAAFKGRKSLKIEWDSSPHSVYNSGPYRKTLEATSRQPGKVARNVGDVDAAFAKGGKIIEAEYYAPHLAHVSMEPPVAVAEYRDGKVLAWAPTQNPQAVQETIAGVLGIKKEDVICHVTLLGGGFGRKSKPDQVAEAAVLSKQLGKPVKVVWSREDDIHCDFFHSVAAMYMKAAVGPDGKPTAWLQRSVFPPINSTFDASATYGDDEMGLGWNNLPFDIPNHRAENGPADYHVRIGWLRSVANIYHAFAIHSFADELAKAANKDSVQYLLDLIGPPRIVNLDLKGDEAEDAKNYPLDTARLRRVVEIAAEKSGWGKKPMGKGHGMGIAAHRSFLTYVATVVEVEVDSKGQVHIPNVWTAVDAGTVVSPDNIRNQFEGAAVFGTSLALFGEITATNGTIDQSNFNNYQIARMSRAPRHVEVHIVESEAPPAGVGEPGVPPFAPALCNAVFAATGKRVRELPLSKTKLG